jgi:hypothetical protein
MNGREEAATEPRGRPYLVGGGSLNCWPARSPEFRSHGLRE